MEALESIKLEAIPRPSILHIQVGGDLNQVVSLLTQLKEASQGFTLDKQAEFQTKVEDLEKEIHAPKEKTTRMRNIVRAVDSIKELTTSAGTTTTAVIGIVNTISKAVGGP